MSRQLHLSVNYNPGLGIHPGRWRFVDDPHQFYDINAYIKIAQVAEAGAFDAVFLSDVPSLREAVPRSPWHVLDPLEALAAIAVRTSHIGLIATASTTFNEPYNLARRLASLDHISQGRAAWNIVTTQRDESAANFGTPLPPHDQRYRRASEFVDVVRKLWDSWEEGALVADKASGQFVDAARLHPIHHAGEYFKVRGPLQVPRTPQGRPVLVQAGASEEGLGFAARYADVVFSLRPTLESAQGYYRDLKDRVIGQGRHPGDVNVLSGVYPVVASTVREAYAYRDQLDRLIDFDFVLGQLSQRLRVELTQKDLDKPPPRRPDLPYLATSSVGLSQNGWESLEVHGNLTLREIIVGQHTTIRHVVGTPEDIADDLELWFRNGAADGFNVSATHFPEGLERFVDQVLPVLRKRGLFRGEYEGATFRGHLGLGVPPSQFASATRARAA